MFTRILILVSACLLLSAYTFSTEENGEWTRTSGVVAEAYPDYFILDSGLKVEMDDWDEKNEGLKILDDDYVIVYGRIDNDLLEKRTIEASSVYVRSVDTYYYASSDDEEPEPIFEGFVYENDEIPNGVNVVFKGTIQNINKNKLILNTGFRKVKIDISHMAENPLEVSSKLNIEEGDHIEVYGEIDDHLYKRDELQAKWIISLEKQ